MQARCSCASAGGDRRKFDPHSRARQPAPTNGWLEAEGFVALYTHNGIIVGATFVAAHAGESLPLLTLAVAQRMTPDDLAAVIHCYPTQVEAIQRVAAQAAAAFKAPVGAL